MKPKLRLRSKPTASSRMLRAEAAQEMQRAREALRNEVAALAVAGAEQILAREVDKTVHAAMLEQLKAKL